VAAAALPTGAAVPPLLLTPLALRGLTARNRVVVSPMCQYSSQDGGPTDWHLVHLGKFALGGAAIVFAKRRRSRSARKTWLRGHLRRPLYADVSPHYHFLRQNGALPAMQLATPDARHRAARHGQTSSR
jgi:2,4-dienoyl-CoA reductase-like NADH-dependent reductase (Old Yellow Enzyme family)